VQGLILNTDFDWYSFLRDRQPLDEVNFWQPSGATTFHRTAPGTPVFFKLKAAHAHAVCGFGIFASASVLPAWLAWDSFGERNGAATFDAMIFRLEKYRPGDRRDAAGRYNVGCLMIGSPAFFERSEWIAGPADWKGQTVQGKAEELQSGEGARIYRECLARVQSGAALAQPMLVADAAPQERYGKPTLVMPRVGQGIFRIAVTDAYARACAITGEHSLPALEAAHIRPYSRDGEHRVSNGLLLRSDIHRLFDKGYVTIDADRRFLVSSRLKADFENGRSYYPLHGREIHVPKAERDQPSREALLWHGDNVFLG